jgi:SAM-dependent methyltransferase
MGATHDEERDMDLQQAVRQFWDHDAATYDHSATHWPQTAAEVAAWTQLLQRALPAPPARVLDVGAGTGFLSLPAARLGHEVTAADLSEEMLSQLGRKAEGEGLSVATVATPADEPPAGPFDAVMCRHLLWTLADPWRALRRWRGACEEGRLLIVEGAWGRVEPGQRWRARARRALRRLRREASAHHGTYDSAVWRALPMAGGTDPSAVVEAAHAAGWRDAALHRLRDVEWTRVRVQPVPERWLGTIPQFAVTAR